MEGPRLLLVGFGHVGRTLCEILAARPRPPGLADFDVRVVAITTGHHGALADPRGLDLAAALAAYATAGRFSETHPAFAALTSPAAAANLDYDVLVELSPLSVRGRGEPAISHAHAALARGRHVVSANKGPIAWAYRRLDALARRHHCAFLFESAVMDGAPVFNLARTCLRGDAITRIEGILNSTTNVVLGEMERGVPLPEAIAAAERFGVAEADSSLDLDGWDAAVKLAALANVLLGADLVPEGVTRTGLDGLTGGAVQAPLRRGRRLKQVCTAWRDGASVEARVELREVDALDPLAAVAGTSSVIRFETEVLGQVVLRSENPDLATTAFGVIADLLAIRSGRWR